ncbi:hypothetical protein D3C83_247890 [compost metagenome]
MKPRLSSASPSVSLSFRFASACFTCSRETFPARMRISSMLSERSFVLADRMSPPLK